MTPRFRAPALATRDARALRIGAWILVPALLAAFVLRPATTALLAGRAAVERERALLVREQRLLADAPHDAAMLRAARVALDQSAPRLFAGPEVVTASAELARYVGARATETGLTLERLESETFLPGADSASAVGGGAETLRVSLRAEGDVVSIVSFLRRLEEGARMVRVERLNIEKRVADDSTDDGTLTLDATIAGLADIHAPAVDAPAARARLPAANVAAPRAGGVR